VSEQTAVFVYSEDSTTRLDKFLTSQLKDFSRSRLQNLIKMGNVQVDGERITKTGFFLEQDMEVEIRIPPPEKPDLKPEAIPLDIIFENDDLMLVNKPAGMVVHPSSGHVEGTLVHAALAHAPNIKGVGGVKRPGIVHRLDKNTSGLIVLAKNDRAHQWLQNQFRDRQVKKIYTALVDGSPPTPQGRIEAAIGRDPAHRKKMAVVPLHKGREAFSLFKTLENFDQHTLLEINPLTGRTHQIRVHLAFIGCPVAGDTVYGRRHATIPVKRHYLHASQLEIIIPGEAIPRRFEAPLPLDLAEILDTLRK
jgi:23S rRNA pseudouridine1911/1915/1917 synthase